LVLYYAGEGVKEMLGIWRYLSYAVRCIAIGVIAVSIFIFCILFIPLGNESPQWGVTFSSKYAQELGLDWRKTYSTVLEELKPDAVRIAAYWDTIEEDQNNLDFSDLDWQMDRAAENGIPVILALGMKVPRWPECHIPFWAISLSSSARENALRTYMYAVVERYRTHPALWRWQVENEPYLFFGKCPERENGFLAKEILLVSSLDPDHAIVLTSEGLYSRDSDKEQAASILQADVIGVNIYTQHPFPTPADYISLSDEGINDQDDESIGPWNEALIKIKELSKNPRLFGVSMRISELIIRMLAGSKEVIITELQAEPWTQNDWFILSAQEQEELFPASLLRIQAQGAMHTARFSEIYLWGAEWWYYLHLEGHSDIWNTAKEILAYKKE
jgi:hypothetical protein